MLNGSIQTRSEGKPPDAFLYSNQGPRRVGPGGESARVRKLETERSEEAESGSDRAKSIAGIYRERVGSQEAF